MSIFRIDGAASHTLIHADAKEAPRPEHVSLLVLDPEWDKWGGVLDINLPTAESTLAFTSPNYIGDTIRILGPPTHLFAWDCMAAIEVSRTKPMLRLKLCLWYGDPDDFWLDASRYQTGESVRARNGKRLQELYRETGYSIRQVVERRGHPYAKPVPWMQALIGGIAKPGIIFDPFAGSGTTLFAADTLGRSTTLVERDRACVESIIAEARREGMTVTEEVETAFMAC